MGKREQIPLAVFWEEPEGAAIPMKTTEAEDRWHSYRGGILKKRESNKQRGGNKIKLDTSKERRWSSNPSLLLRAGRSWRKNSFDGEKHEAGKG